MKTSTTTFVVLTYGLVSVMLGCSSSSDALADKLVGRWEGKEKPEFKIGREDTEKQDANYEWQGKDKQHVEFEVDMSNVEPLTMKVEFRKDGTMTTTLPLFEIPIAGTWKPLRSEEKKLTIHTVLEMPSFSIEGSGEEEGDKQPTTTQRTEVKSEKGEQELTIVFETDDRIVITAADDPEPLTLERKSGP